MSVKLNSSGGGSVTLTEPTTASDYSVTFRAASGNVVITPVPAGNTTVAPLVLSSGTNLSTAAAGSMEYNGATLLFTPISTQRGVVPGIQFYCLNTNLAGVNGTANQSVFGVGTTLSSSTIYRFQMIFYPYKTAGTTSHTMAVSFGGTANVNWIAYESRWNATTAYNTQAAGGSYQTGTSLSPVIVTSARTAANEYATVRLAGLVSINNGGTLIPQYSLSAAPGGAYTVLAGSWIEIYPVSAAGSNVSIGTWA
jgi:hypothetical protein